MKQNQNIYKFLFPYVHYAFTTVLDFASFSTSDLAKKTSPRLNLLLNDGSAYDKGCLTAHGMEYGMY